MNWADRLKPLLEEARPAISIHLPLDPGQRDARAAAARLRQLMDESEEKLRQQGYDVRAAESLLARAREFAKSADFVRHRDPGLALFFTAARFDALHLPVEPPSCAVVARHFHIKPLLPLLAGHRRFHVLALSGSNARLFTATAHSWEEQRLEMLPPEAQAQLGSLPAAELAPGGEESIDEARKALMVEDLRRVAVAVRAALGADTAPLVLAAEPHLCGHFTKLAHLPQLYGESIQLNPFALTEPELHSRARAMLRPVLEAELGTVLEQANARLMAGEPTASARIEEILVAAHEGRVDAVLVAQDRSVWGTYDLDRVIVAHDAPRAADEDLLNEAAVVTLRNGGRAFCVPLQSMPRQSPAVATLRY